MIGRFRDKPIMRCRRAIVLALSWTICRTRYSTPRHARRIDGALSLWFCSTASRCTYLRSLPFVTGRRGTGDSNSRPYACNNGYKDRARCVVPSLKELDNKRRNTHAELHCSRHAPLSSRERATDSHRFLSERQWQSIDTHIRNNGRRAKHSDLAACTWQAVQDSKLAIC